ncbi:MAG: prolipoprotein diacylglyceryl transferase [Pseudomonadales bacterium]|nr:prolipoprotein diacylglyceryl transferase [Pseudomonadales bacterium]
MQYPIIDEVIIALGPISVRWYGLMYLLAFSLAWWLGNWRSKNIQTFYDVRWTPQEVSDVIFYGAMGAVLGGRAGYVFFYGFEQFLQDPIWLFRVWDGGMSFHGGLLGGILSLLLFSRKVGRHFVAVCDFVVILVPPGLGLGRIGNFINTELPGRLTDSAFGLQYPCSAVRGLNPLCTGEYETFGRHVSSLYQAFSEGILLFILIWLFAAAPRRPGAVTGVFLIAYGCARFCTEFFRSPDVHLGFVALDWLSMGQILSLPMVLLGVIFIYYGRTLDAKQVRKA